MTSDESLPTYDFKIPLEIKNLEKKTEILQLWENAKNAFATNDVEKISSNLTQITELDDSLYGVWYNLGIAEDFTGWYFDMAIELKPDHIDSWRGKERHHQLGIRDFYGDDNLDQHIHSHNYIACGHMCEEIEVMNKFKKLKFTGLNEDQLSTFFMDFEYSHNSSYVSGTNVLNLGLCCLKYSMYDEAIKLLENSREENILDFYFLGIAYRLSGNFEKAIEQFDKILNLEPENVYALLQKGLILYEKEQSVDEITKILLKNTDEKITTCYTNRDGEPTKMTKKTTLVKPNPVFFEICLNDSGTYFPRDPFELSLEMIMNGFNEKIIEQINLDTKNLYDYTKFEKINETWNGCYHDFEI